MLKKLSKFLKRPFLFLTTTTVILTVGFTERSAQSAVLALSDENSIAAFDTSSSDPGNSGLIFWTVDDINHLFQSQFWYRVGSTSGENPINNLNLIGLNQTQPTSNMLTASYAGAGFEIELNYRLNGGKPGSGHSSLFENIEIKNTSSNPLDFHLFKYTDFDLTDNGQEDSTKIGYGMATQFDNFTLATEVIKPSASYYQVAPFPDILNALTDNLPTTLTNFPGTLTGENSYAFQWSFDLEPETFFSITNYTSIKPVPEATITLGWFIGSAALGLFWRFRRDRVS
ncbi:hypothetical protein [Anabaena sp. CCY 9402-a]|uniref:hypothetical protein n=1 Tax=Anabaena sp. CCY 9402-a TaxID=3103867 RepID=UPI0039C628E5